MINSDIYKEVYNQIQTHRCFNKPNLFLHPNTNQICEKLKDLVWDQVSGQVEYLIIDQMYED